MGEGPRWLGGTLYGWGEKRGVSCGVGWGHGYILGDKHYTQSNGGASRMASPPSTLDRYIYIHSCDLSSVGDDRGGGCRVMTYWPVDGWGHPRSTPERSSVSAPWPPNFRH